MFKMHQELNVFNSNLNEFKFILKLNLEIINFSKQLNSYKLDLRSEI